MQLESCFGVQEQFQVLLGKDGRVESDEHLAALTANLGACQVTPAAETLASVTEPVDQDFRAHVWLIHSQQGRSTTRSALDLKPQRSIQSPDFDGISAIGLQF